MRREYCCNFVQLKHRIEIVMSCRSGEVKPATFRSDRFCQIDGNWYFVTREKTMEGPYEDRILADAGASHYVAELQTHPYQNLSQRPV